MTPLVRIVSSLILIASAGLVSAQEKAEPDPVVVKHLVGPLHALRCNDTVHMIASIGRDGTLLVDTGYRGTAAAVQQALAELGSVSIDVVVNTHADGDHVGGNGDLGQGATIIAHHRVRERMRSYFALPVADPGGLPNLSLDGPATIHFNGEAIRLVPLAGGHTDADLVVHFQGSGVVFVGDLLLEGIFPVALHSRGGDAQRLAEVLSQLVEELPHKTRVVAAHGRDQEHALELGVDDLRAYIEMIEGSVAAVRRELALGHSLAKIQEAQVMEPWAELAGPVSAEAWTEAVHSSITGASPLPSICEPLTEILVTDGLEAAVAAYRRLRADKPDSFSFAQGQLNRLGYELLGRNRVQEAIAIFGLNVEVFPDDFDVYDSLGEAWMVAGDREKAIANYQRSLELNPDNHNGTAMLRRLKGE